MLDYFGAEASVGGVNNSSILLRENPSKAAVLEEFLHGAQARLGIADRLGTSGLGSAETHVKDFIDATPADAWTGRRGCPHPQGASRQGTMNMSQELLIREVFRLGGGTTVLACEGTVASDVLTGRRARLVFDGRVRQGIVLASEGKMLNQTEGLSQRALETLDQVEVLPDEVQSGRCRLVLDPELK